MTDVQKKAAVKQFVKDWIGHGGEKQDTQRFWMALLQKVYGVEEPDKAIEFEVRVKLDHTSFIDGYIKDTHVLIEQKGMDVDLRKGYRQSDGSMLTPFQQARRYAGYLPHNMNPRWIVVCNFKEFHIHDMNRPNDTPEIIRLDELESEYSRLQFLVDTGNERIKKEMQISLQAGELVGSLYDSLLKQYTSPATPAELKSLNMLCVRLVFCLYAEDAGIFGSKTMFHDYLRGFQPKNVRKALIDLFRVLDTKAEDRDPYMDEDLAAFPYVNGGLFADENIIIPRFTEEIVNLLLSNASEDFDWSEISPTIFGAVFESTLNPETRRSGGMHYTSIENIHKVIDPLFMDALWGEWEEVKGRKVQGGARAKGIAAFHEKIASLRFLDPACGSGNFLTETYLSLRRLENEIIRDLYSGDEGQFALGEMAEDILAQLKIKVSIGQFYGIEVNDFAVTVAKTALWIAESQMMKETEQIVHMQLDFLPLRSYANITEGNALTIDWESVISKSNLDYIMGNPPFVGGMYMSEQQKYEIRELFPEVSGAGEFDYVTGWYKKAVQFSLGTKIHCAFVSTNSICQGSSVITFWKYLIEGFSIHIDFAYTTFVWNNETNNQAKVHCVIVGFSGIKTGNQPKKLYSQDKKYKLCDHISPYLTDCPVVFVESRSKPICSVPKMRFGSMPRDGGGFILSTDEKNALIKSDPIAEKWIRPYIGAVEFLNNKERYCLWLVNAEPCEINKCPTVKKRVEYVREVRAASKAAGTRKFASTPTLFCQIAQPDGDYIVVPKTSSGKRKYIPLGFMDKDTIASDLVFLIPDAGLYEFGVLMSNVHNAWMRLVAGRLKSDYRYAKDIVYNNFPWPVVSEKDKTKIIETAKGILDARAKYKNSSLAELYDETLMPPELRKAHQQNDKAVMQAYGFWGKLNTETECVAELMKLYSSLTK